MAKNCSTVLRQIGADGHAEAREKLAGYEDFAADRREEVVVQALVEDLAAEQVHEDSQAAEEDGQPQIEHLEHGGEDVGVQAEIAGAAGRRRASGCVAAEQQDGREGDEVDPQAAAGEEGLGQLQPDDGPDLSQAQIGQHAGKHTQEFSSEPIRYS